MKRIRVFINGFGRIGRALLRSMLEDDRFEIAGINDLYPYEQFAYLFRYDSVYGTLRHRVMLQNDTMAAAGRTIRLFNAEDAESLPLDALGIDVLFQCSGVHLTQNANRPYCDGGAGKIIVSAPPRDGMPMFIAGVNAAAYDGEPVVSSSSCSANAITPVLQLLHEHAGVEAAAVSMIHSYTAEQHLLDTPSHAGELLRSRSATTNILPLASSATFAVGKLLPELAQRFEAHSIRVPVPAGTLYDFSVQLQQPFCAEEVNKLFASASRTRYHRLLAVTEKPLASTDIIGDPHGITLESARTKVIGNKFVRLLGWQDNEAGYVAQMLRLALRMHDMH